jgi:hypothetical protein
LIVIFIFYGVPLGFGATVIVVALIARRAGPWWRREQVPSLMAANA